MPSAPAQFIWYEVMTEDMAAAATFYQAVVGWSVQPLDRPGMDYSLLQIGDRGVAGVLLLDDEAKAAGARPSWIGYIGVDDVDAYVKQVIAAGGALHRAAEDIADVGRFAVVGDPQGAVFQLFKPLDGMSRPTLDPATPGLIGWHELLAVESQPAFDFYSRLFGWTRSSVYDMGAMGGYQLFKAGGEDIGGMMTKPVSIPFAHWNYYIQVDGIEAAAARVMAAGGSVVRPPHQVPSGNWVLHGRDPGDAFFALLSRTR